LKNKKVLFLKKKNFGRSAKIHPKDGVSRLNFPEGFDDNSMQAKLEPEPLIYDSYLKNYTFEIHFQ
jgi:hypothetical protein